MLMIKDRLSLNNFVCVGSPSEPSKDISLCDKARERCLYNDKKRGGFESALEEATGQTGRRVNAGVQTKEAMSQSMKRQLYMERKNRSVN